MSSEIILALVVGLAVGTATGTTLMASMALRRGPYACGEKVLVKKYEGSDWEMGTVVAVSWHGSVCVRPEGQERGIWMRPEKAETRVRRVRA